MRKCATLQLIAVCLGICFFIFPCFAASAGQPSDQGQTTKIGEDRTTTNSPKSKGPVYKPPLVGAPEGRVGGGTRGVGDNSVILLALAPRHVGLTTLDAPVLYWYLSEPFLGTLTLSVSEDKAEKPMGGMQLPMPGKGGIYSISLKDHVPRLKEKVLYHWFLEAIPDRGLRKTAGGSIKKIAMPDQLAKKLSITGKNELHYVYAETGIWYDALFAVSEAIRANPGNELLRQERQSLLEQIGLGDRISKE